MVGVSRIGIRDRAYVYGTHSYMDGPACMGHIHIWIGLRFATTIGNAKDFSEIDLAKINRMYGCSEAYLTSLQPRAQSSVIYSPPSLKRYDVLPAINDRYFDKFSTEMGHKNCKDRIAACWMTQDRCHSQALFLLMKTLCAKTCKLC
uniref:ShKT domain-containing protein n=1 Tax=Loa loa TaxID=7209 RepID=A0A1I7W460_LOALO